MKIIIAIIVLAIAAAAGYVYAKHSDGSPLQALVKENKAQKTDFDTIKSEFSSGAVLFDVRTSEEFQSAHIEGAQNFPLQKMQAGELPDVSKDKPVYVFCRSGSRSAEAVKLLRQAGFSDVYDLGAMDSVAKMGGKVIK